MAKWGKEKIIKAYKKACDKAQKMIYSSDFDKYESLPCYSVVMNHFDSIKHLRYQAGLIDKEELEKRKTRELTAREKRELKERLLCDDCLKEPYNCDKNIEDCWEEAEEEGYFDFIDENKLARRKY